MDVTHAVRAMIAYNTLHAPAIQPRKQRNRRGVANQRGVDVVYCVRGAGQEVEHVGVKVFNGRQSIPNELLDASELVLVVNMESFRVQ